MERLERCRSIIARIVAWVDQEAARGIARLNT
jgi:hypothetical protein